METSTKSMKSMKFRNGGNPYATNIGAMYNSTAFNETGQSLSPGKSIYLASEQGSSTRRKVGGKPLRLGGHKTPLRALNHVMPYLNKKGRRGELDSGSQ